MMEGVHPPRAPEAEQLANETKHCQSDAEPSNPCQDGQHLKSDQVQDKEVPELSTNRFEGGWGWGTWLPSSTAIQEVQGLKLFSAPSWECRRFAEHPPHY